MKKLAVIGIIGLGSILIFGFTATTVQASGREAGGGHAVRVGDQTYLFDFFESGLETSARVDFECSVDAGMLKQVASVLDLDDRLAKGIACKFIQLRAISPKIASKLMQALFSYQWQRLVPELFKRYDIGQTPIQTVAGKQLPLIQAAIRFDDRRATYIDRLVWDTLPDAHKIGLIFHEIIFALYSQRFNETQFVWHYCYNGHTSPASDSSRGFNAFIFSRAIEVSTKKIIEQRWASLMKAAETDYVCAL